MAGGQNIFQLWGEVALRGADEATRELEGLEQGARTTGRTVSNMGRMMNDSTSTMARGFGGVSSAVGETNQTTRQLYKDLVTRMRTNNANLTESREKLIQNKIAWLELTESSQDFQGSNAEFLDQLEELGAAQKAIQKEMMANNEVARAGFFQSVGALLNMTTQSESVIKNYDRMGNPLLQANNVLLQGSHRLEELAHRGSAAVLAVRMLGPTASMTELTAQTNLINQGLMRFQAVALAAAVALGVMVGALVKAAYGEAPAKIREQMAEVKQIYSDALADRKKELYEWAGLFEDVEFKPPKKETLMAALAEQVKIFDGWTANLKMLAERGVNEGLIAELEKMGPKGAAEIQALTTMTDAELTEYANLWGLKQKQGNDKAVSELSGLKTATDKKVQELKNSITPLAESWEKFKETWAGAFDPFVESFGEVAAKLVDFGTKVGEFFQKLNENDMGWVIKAGGWFVILSTALTLILAPLAIGIGLIPGFLAGWALLAPMVMPLVTGLAAMSATVWIVVAAIIALIAIGVLVYKNWDEIKAWLIKTWETVKEKSVELWGKMTEAISNSWEKVKEKANTIWAAIWGFLQKYGLLLLGPIGWLVQAGISLYQNWDTIKAKMVAIWNSISTTASNIFNGIKNTISNAWNAITSTTSNVWNSLKNTISNAMNAATNTVSNGIEKIKGWFSSLAGRLNIKIPHIKMPHFRMSGSFSLKPPSVPKLSVDWYEKGGIFDGPNVIGVGESGKEAVLPLEGRYMAPLAQAIAKQLPTAAGGAITVEVPLIINGREIARAIASDIDTEFKRQSQMKKRGV